MYFNEIGIFRYYPEILPHLVFVDPQVLLDKVNELIQYAVSLRDQTIMQTAPVAGKWKKFVDKGNLTIDMLESAHFRRHFEKGLFSPADMITIMTELVIIAPLSAIEADYSLCGTEFFMPSLLMSVPPSELEKYRVFTSPADPLVIRFPNNCVPYGMFCCLVVLLIKKFGWGLCLLSDLPARNCVRFRIHQHPHGLITLIDSFSYIEVHVKAPLNVCIEICPKIREIIIEGIELASASLHHHSDHPVATIFCSHKRTSEESFSRRHHADVYYKSGYWTMCCSRDIDCVGMLLNNHIIWFSNESISSGKSYYNSIVCVILYSE